MEKENKQRKRERGRVGRRRTSFGLLKEKKDRNTEKGRLTSLLLFLTRLKPPCAGEEESHRGTLNMTCTVRLQGREHRGILNVKAA